MPKPGPKTTNKIKATNDNYSSPESHETPVESVLPPHGGYENLLSFQKARIVYDATVRFCERFVDKRSRTHDQMTQAARSGKQNIVEASQASGTSKETELKFTNVARASLEELLEDYRDILRTSGNPLWDKNSREALFVRRLGANPISSCEFYRPYVETRPVHIVSNILICLIHQTNYLLDQQIRRLEQDFLQEGGLRERMARGPPRRPRPPTPRKSARRLKQGIPSCHEKCSIYPQKHHSRRFQRRVFCRSLRQESTTEYGYKDRISTTGRLGIQGPGPMFRHRHLRWQQ
jgi:four helix bundle suffix protein